MAGYGIEEGFETAVEQKIFFIFDLPVNHNDSFLENILGIIRRSVVAGYEMMDDGIIFLINILQNGIIA